MRFTFFAVLLCTVMITFSCNKIDLLTEDTPVDFHEIAIDNLNTSAFENGVNGVQSLRNGTQKINDNQTNDDLERGIPVSLPIFDDTPVSVAVGSWITLRFSFQDDLIPLSNVCEENISEEQLNAIFTDVETFINDFGLRLSFNGEDIDILSYFRSEKISNYISSQTGNCRYILPWRYYVNPQSKGDAVFSVMYGGEEYSRTISWVKKEKPTK